MRKISSFYPGPNHEEVVLVQMSQEDWMNICRLCYMGTQADEGLMDVDFNRLTYRIRAMLDSGERFVAMYERIRKETESIGAKQDTSGTDNPSS